MAKPVILPRQEIVDRLFELFRSSGFEAVSLSDISRATGLGRSSLYHHFPGGKEDMLAAVLDRASAAIDAALLAPLRSQEPHERRIDAMLVGIERLYGGGAQPCLIASLLLGRFRQPLAARVRALLAGWIDGLTQALIDAGLPEASARARAEASVGQVQGALVVARALDDPAPFQRMLRRVRDELTAA